MPGAGDMNGTRRPGAALALQPSTVSSLDETPKDLSQPDDKG